MLRISLVLLGLYAIHIILKIGFQFTVIPYVIFAPFLIAIVLIPAVIRLLNKEASKKNIIATLVLIIPLIGFYFERIQGEKEDEKIVLSAYSEGVISGADITFYENEKVKYCSATLIGEQCYFGTYEMKEDTILVAYFNKSPILKSRRMVKKEKRLLFLNGKNDVEHEFYIGRKYIKKKN